MLSRLKAVWIVFWWALNTLVFFAPIILAGLVDPRGNLAFRLCQGWVWVARMVCGVRLDIRGGEQTARDRSYVVMSNHQSLFDIPALMLGLGLQLRWVIKKSYIYVPLFGWALYLTKHVFIDRSNPKKAIDGMARAARRLPPGSSIMVFPEGTRSDDGVVRQFRAGGFLLAAGGGLPILPVTVNGSWRVMPDKRSLEFFPGTIQVVIGEPIDTAGYDKSNLTELMDRTRAAIVANLDPDYPGGA